MIKVYIKNNFIEVSGHAEYDRSGKDIVCASVSTLIISTINLCELFNKLDCIKYSLKEGLFSLEILKNDNIVDVLYLNFKNSLCDLESQYPKYIKIKQ